VATFGEWLAGLVGVNRVLVTGSRTWTNEGLVAAALAAIEAHAWSPTLVHGGAGRGLDRIARDWAAGRGTWTIESHSAEWDKHGRRAGVIRNAEMVRDGADLCVAFIHNGSPGATHCAAAAEKAGIPTWRFTR